MAEYFRGTFPALTKLSFDGFRCMDFDDLPVYETLHEVSRC